MHNLFPHNSFTEDATVEELKSQELIPPFQLNDSSGVSLRASVLPRVQSLNLKRIEIPEVRSIKMTDSERYYDTADVISQNNRAYLKGVGFVVAEEGPFSPSTAKPEGGWGVHGPAETKGGRTRC